MIKEMIEQQSTASRTDTESVALNGKLILYRDMFEHAPIGIIQSTPDGRLLKINPAMIRMLGFDPASGDIAAIGNIPRDLYVNPEHRRKLIELIRKKDSLLNFETQLKKKDGSAITCMLHVRGARGENGSVAYLEGFIEDITEKKKIAEALADSEQRYRSVFENTGAGTIIIREDTTISLANAGFEELSGYSKQEIEGRMKWPAIVADPEELRVMLEYHNGRRKNGKKAPLEYEFTFVDKFGDRKSIFARVDMIEGSACSVASLFDITSLKTAKRHLRESESKLSGIVEAFEGFVYMCSRDYRVSYMNKALKRFTEVDGTGKRCYRAVYGVNSPCPWCDRDKVFAGETLKYEFQSPCDSRWYYAVSSPIYGGGETVVSKQTVIIDIHERKLAELALKERDALLRKENKRLRSVIRDRHGFGDIVGKGTAMQTVYDMILRSAATKANVIIYGESGTGKELVAGAVHRLSDRSHGRFVPVNCGAIPQNLMESEFFGYRKGAFTGADKDKPGLFEHAHGGTLFLDEVGEISEEMQVKLLRVLQDGGYMPIGAPGTKRADVRIVAATNKNLKELVGSGGIREDFFYRIHIIPIYLPPLRERREDIPLLVEHFLKKYGSPAGLSSLGGREIEILMNHDWPGNVRELENTLQRYINLDTLDFPGITSRPRNLPATSIPISAGELEEENLPLREAVNKFEKSYITRLLNKHDWNRTRVASFLGVERKTLYLKMKRLGIEVDSSYKF